MGSKRNTIVADVETLAQDDLVDIYKKLADSYRSVKEENDKCKQNLHHQTQQSKMLINSQNDLQNELENINSIHKIELEELTKKNAAAIENSKELNQELISDKNQLEQKVVDLNKVVLDFKKQCDELKARVADLKPAPRVSDGFSRKMEFENENLRIEMQELQAKLSELSMMHSEKIAQIDNLSEKISCLEDNLDSRKIEIEEKNDAIEGMQEKFLELTAELASLKSNPDDANRKGNSLFAEVDDQRKQMKTILQGERTHYLDMKKSFNAKEIEIRRLKRENFNIKQEIHACSSILVRGEKIAIQSLSTQVSHLQNENRKLESLLFSTEKKLIDLAQERNLGWIESLMTTANNESRELKDKLLSVMVEKTSLADNLYKSQKELAKARLDCVKFKILLGRIIETNNVRINEKDFLDIGIDHEKMENLKVERFESLDLSDRIEHEPSQKIDDSAALNESTVVLLGGRERLGKFASSPPPPMSPVKLNCNISPDVDKENLGLELTAASSLANSFMKSPVKPPRAINAMKSPAKPSHVKDVPFKQPESSLSVKTPTKPLQAVELLPHLPKQVVEKVVAFSNSVESKVIDTTLEQFEQPKETRKRPGIVVKRIVIPSKIKTEKPESL